MARRRAGALGYDALPILRPLVERRRSHRPLLLAFGRGASFLMSAGVDAVRLSRLSGTEANNRERSARYPKWDTLRPFATSERNLQQCCAAMHTQERYFRELHRARARDRM